MFKITMMLLLVCTSLCVNAQNADEKAIRQILADQTKAWNSGNIEEYMKGYWQSDSLVYIGKSGPRYGYKSTLANYKRGYPDTSAMGKLDLQVLQLKKLSLEYYFVIGAWHLQRTAGDIQGSFTLLLRKIKNKWYIIADHSS